MAQASRGGGAVSDPRVRFNVVQHPDKVLVKQYRLRDGEVEKDGSASAHIPMGCTVSTVDSTLSEYLAVAHGGGHRQYVLPSNAELGQGVPLGIKRSGCGIDRSADTMRHVSGQPAVLTLDHDPNPRAATTLALPDELHALLIQLFPEVFARAAHAAYYSSSSFIHLPDGATYSGARGFHVAFAVEDAGDIARFAETLFKRLWLHGHGYMHLSRDGKQLPRTVFDRKVVEPQQPLFAGGAHCLDGITQRRPEPVFSPGGYLNTRALPSLTPEEEERYRSAEQAVRQAGEAEARNVRMAYQKVEVNRLVGRGMSMEVARRTIVSRLGGTLLGEDVLHFAEHGRVTVADVLADLDRFDEASLHDPVEPEYGGSSTAMFFANRETGTPIVYSHAHGGRNFFVRHDENTLAALLECMMVPELNAAWQRLLLEARLAEDAVERVLLVIKRRTGTSIGALRKALSRAQRAQVGAEGTEIDPILVISKRFLGERYAEGTHLLMTESGGMYSYCGTHWAPLPETVLLGELQAFCEVEWGWVLSLFENQRSSAPSLANCVSAALQVLQRRVVKPGDPLRLTSERPSVINMRNGELWLEDEGAVLRPHRPESYLTSCSNIFYEPLAGAPGFEMALRGLLSLPGGVPMPDQGEMYRHVVEMLGYAIQTRRNLKVFYLIKGPGDNGKTCLTRLLQRVIGTDAIVSERIGGVDESRSRFATGKLVGKQLLIDDDFDHDALLPDGLLKKIAEEKTMTAEPKFQAAFAFVARVIPIVLSNSWPATRDLSKGMQTRAQVLFLPRQFKKPADCVPGDPDIQRPEVWERVFADELSGVVNILVAGYYRLKARGSFTQPPSAVAALKEWLGSANVVSRFLSEACEECEGQARHSPGPTMTILHSAFTLWADENKVLHTHRPPLYKFGSRLEELGYRLGRCLKGKAVYGIRLNREWAEKLRALSSVELLEGVEGAAI